MHSGFAGQGVVIMLAVVMPAVFLLAVAMHAVVMPAVVMPVVFMPAVLWPAVLMPAVFMPAVFMTAVFFYIDVCFIVASTADWHAAAIADLDAVSVLAAALVAASAAEFATLLAAIPAWLSTSLGVGIYFLYSRLSSLLAIKSKTSLSQTTITRIIFTPNYHVASSTSIWRFISETKISGVSLSANKRPREKWRINTNRLRIYPAF